MEPADFMAEEREDSLVVSMDLRRHTGSLALTLAHLAASIMEESQEASPLAGIQALVEASTEEAAVSTEVEAATEEAVTGNSVQSPETQLIYGGRTHAHEQYEA